MHEDRGGDDDSDPDGHTTAASSRFDWVVLTFADTEQRFDVGVLDAMLVYELAADDALYAAGAGEIDGNDVGRYHYDIYFAGPDRDVTWRLIEPIFADAPIPWTRVELRAEFEDEAPEVITHEATAGADR